MGFSKKTAVLIVSVLLLGLVTIFHVFTTRSVAPSYLGKRLDQWAKEQPQKYYAAIEGLGTNAIPYLLGELAATDSDLARSAQSLLEKVISVGDIFVSSRHRRYYARLGFQVLDTNAVPALIEALFAKPMVRSDSDLGINSAWALSWIDSPSANVLKTDRLTTALFDTDIQVQRNAIIAWTLWASRPTLAVSQRMETYLAGTNRLLKAAAVDFFMGCHTNEQISIPALVRCLNDPDSTIRENAYYGLRSRGTNGIPVLLKVLSQTPTNNFESQHIRSELQRCLKQIDPRLDP